MQKYAIFIEKMPNVVKMSILFKLIYRANATVIKIPAYFLCDKWQVDSNIYMKIKKT